MIFYFSSSLIYLKLNISYFSSKYNSTAFTGAIKGVEITIPTIPQKYPNTSKPMMIVTGCNFVVLDNITGCKKLPSKNCITHITISVSIPVVIPCEKPTITAGIPPIYGPAYGIILVIPQNNPNNKGAFNPTKYNPIEVIIKINEQSSTDPVTKVLNAPSILSNTSLVTF